MEIGSDQSSDDMQKVKVFMGNVNTRPEVEKNPQKEPEGAQEELNFSGTSSMASDEEIPDIKRDIEEEGQEQEEGQEEDTSKFDPVEGEKLYRSVVFGKASNEEILLLASLYLPAAKTQAFYDKLHEIERICKKNSSQNEYRKYLRNQRKYQRQLSDLFAKTRNADFSFISCDDLLSSKRDYQKKIMMKRRKALDSMINKLEDYTPSQDTSLSESEKKFYEIKISDFTEKIVWKTNLKKEGNLGSRKIVKGFEDDKNQVLCVNYNKKEDEEINKSLVFENHVLESGRSETTSFFKLGSMASQSNKISFDFIKKPGNPGKVEIQKPPVNDQSHWGDFLCKKQNRSENLNFTIKKRKFLFTECLDHQIDVPTNTNPFYPEPYWNDLVFNREIPKLKERYGQLVHNMLGPSTSSIKHQEIPPSSNEEDENDQLNDFESKTGKSTLQELPIIEDKYIETSMKARVTILKHAMPAYEYPLLKTEWTPLELRNFHRPEVILTGQKWKVKLSSQKKFKSRGEVASSFSMMNSSKQLSIKEGGFLLMEYLEKRPLLLSNFGMGSKIRRYLLGERRNNEEFKKYVGKMGVFEYIDSNVQFPLIGNLMEGSALAVLENNLFRVPVYCQDPRQTDFLMIKYQKKNGKLVWYLRNIENLATSGQIEPKLEVMAPNARNTNFFQKKRIQTFIFNTLVDKDNKIEIREILEKFENIQESWVRKQMKHIFCEQQSDGFWTCSKLPSKQEVKDMITPEEICQYESMLAGQRRLKDKGLNITSIDKVPIAIQKLKKEMENKDISYLADLIEEELTITPWNLTSSYLKTKDEKGLMRITGIGDPTHGYCGFSFVRLTSKDPNPEKPDSRNDPSDYLPGNMAVTGTEADLRKLTKEDIKKLLLKIGNRKEEIENIGRWTGVEMLRKKASKLVSEGHKGTVEKYARGIRMSKKMQKDQYQKTIDEIFQKQIKILGEKREYGSEKGSDSDDDYLTKKVTESINKAQKEKIEKVNKYNDNEINEIKNLEDFKISKEKFAIAPAFQSKTFTNRVLKRTIKMKNLEGRVTVKVFYITDLKEIEDFQKKTQRAAESQIKKRLVKK